MNSYTIIVKTIITTIDALVAITILLNRKNLSPLSIKMFSAFLLVNVTGLWL